MSVSCQLPQDPSLCRRPLPREHTGTYSVTSVGGVGSTFLLEWLKRLHRGFQREADCALSNHARDGCGTCAALAGGHGALPRHLVSCHIDDDGIFKHLADPIALNGFGAGHRAVYLVGSPVHAVSSVFRRRFQCWHLHRLHGCWFSRRQREGRIPCDSAELEHFRGRFGQESTTCRVPPSGPLSSLAAYAENGEDLFGVLPQFQSWLSCRAPRCVFDILVIRYETLNASLPTLFDFLGLPQRVRALFPYSRLRPAKSGSPAGLGLESHRQMLSVYGPLEAALQRIPPEGLLLRNAPDAPRTISWSPQTLANFRARQRARAARAAGMAAG